MSVSGWVLSVDNLVLLLPSEADLQCSLERFAAAECDVTGMRVNASKTKSLVLFRSPVRISLQINGETVKQVEKLKYLGTIFTSDGQLEEEIDRRIGVASGVLRELARPVVTKGELGLKTKLSVFKSIFIPLLTYGPSSCDFATQVATPCLWNSTQDIFSALADALGLSYVTNLGENLIEFPLSFCGHCAVTLTISSDPDLATCP
ncbi:unnamed protein product [Soboliphyme baturini]|uniref:Reverse transcriptase domain-containing protein n=1 Tax=Soboliphyme baturini TaxID=241478 RepID=A0A183IF28_9BILA|nr:unnamed protein product [Soboliphyme baturini]